MDNTMSKTKNNIRINLKGLDDIREKLGTNYVTRVGILGSKAGETHQNVETKPYMVLDSGQKVRRFVEGSTISNAELGIIHEFGSIGRNIPPRSFLRMPIEAKFPEIIAFLRGERIAELLVKGDIKKIYELIGIKAENIIQQAFSSGGFGRWAALKPATIKAKGTSAILIATSQLRRAISSEAVKR